MGIMFVHFCSLFLSQNHFTSLTDSSDHVPLYLGPRQHIRHGHFSTKQALPMSVELNFVRFKIWLGMELHSSPWLWALHIGGTTGGCAAGGAFMCSYRRDGCPWWGSCAVLSAQTNQTTWSLRIVDIPSNYSQTYNPLPLSIKCCQIKLFSLLN